MILPLTVLRHFNCLLETITGQAFYNRSELDFPKLLDFRTSTRQRLQEALGLKHEDHFREAYLTPALRSGLIEMTIPDKPRSSKQRYRLTAAGNKYLKQTEENR